MPLILQSPVDDTSEFRKGWSLAALQDRIRAASLGLTVSATVVGSVAVTIALLLHTLPFFWASGGIGLIAIVAMVDIVLGPLLIFLVYDRRKKELRRDLAVIVCLQLAAIAYGVYASVLARPVLMTFVVDRFELVSAAEVDAEELEKAPKQFRKLSWTGPVLAAARMPDSREEREQIMFESIGSGIDLRHLLRYYVDYSTQRDKVIARSRPLSDLRRYNDPARVAEVLGPITMTAENPERLRYLPVQGPKEDLVAVVDRSNAALLATIRLRPWE